MMYPFLTLNDGTEIVHSEVLENGEVKVHIETPDEELGFKQATCFLPTYRWENIEGYDRDTLDKLKEIIESTAHLIIEFAREGGFANAANL